MRRVVKNIASQHKHILAKGSNLMFFIVCKQNIKKYIESVITTNSHAQGFMIRQGQGGGFLREEIAGRGKFVKNPNSATVFKELRRIVSHCGTLTLKHGFEPCLYMLVNTGDGSMKLELIMLLVAEDKQEAV